jgi:hypothetical protein
MAKLTTTTLKIRKQGFAMTGIGSTRKFHDIGRFGNHREASQQPSHHQLSE